MLNRTTSLIVLTAIVVAAAPLATAETPDNGAMIDSGTALRCSAAFALVSDRQRHGQAGQYPTLAARGREFFVQAGARLMDQEHLDRGRMQQRFRNELAKLQGELAGARDPEAALRGVMDPCLKLLDVAIPAT